MVVVKFVEDIGILQPSTEPPRSRARRFVRVAGPKWKNVAETGETRPREKRESWIKCALKQLAATQIARSMDN